MKFAIDMFKETYNESGNLSNKETKTVELDAQDCCDACIKATKSNRDWTVKSWKCLDKKIKTQEFIPENKYEKEAWARVLKMRAEAKDQAQKIKS